MSHRLLNAFAVLPLAGKHQELAAVGSKKGDGYLPEPVVGGTSCTSHAHTGWIATHLPLNATSAVFINKLSKVIFAENAHCAFRSTGREQRRLENVFTLPHPDTPQRSASAPNSPKATRLPSADGTKNNWNSDTVLSSLIEQLDLVRLDWRPLENARR